MSGRGRAQVNLCESGCDVALIPGCMQQGV